MSITHELPVSSDEQSAHKSVHLRRIDTPHAVTLAAGGAGEMEEAGEGGEDAAAGGETDSASFLELEEPTAEMIAAVAGDSLESHREQMQLQIAQLAGHLRDRLREVDRREAAVYARASQLESDSRASRLWIQEREIAFQEREREFQRRIEELEERASPRVLEAETTTESCSASLAELQEREQSLRAAEDEVRERRFEIEREAVGLRHAQQFWQQQREREERSLAQQREQATCELQDLTEQREAQLRAAEVMLSEHVQQFERERSSWVGECQAWEQQRDRQQQAMAELRSNTEADLVDMRARLDARQDWIERQKTGLEQVRDEALRLHRQSLEMRLMAEQLWSQISGAMAPAEVTQAIAQTRLKLTEQYRVEEQQLAARREELLKLAESIAAQHAELEQLRAGLRDWVTVRQEEIEQQAAALVERELSLDAQLDAHRRSEREWQKARRGYEQQIRDLLSQLRTLPAAA